MTPVVALIKTIGEIVANPEPSSLVSALSFRHLLLFLSLHGGVLLLQRKGLCLLPLRRVLLLAVFFRTIFVRDSAYRRLTNKQRIQQLLRHLLHDVCAALRRGSCRSGRAQSDPLGVVGIGNLDLLLLLLLVPLVFAVVVLKIRSIASVASKITIQIQEFGSGQITTGEWIDKLQLAHHVEGQGTAVKKIQGSLAEWRRRSSGRRRSLLFLV
mmetsp:Transcript_14090/g.32477  ORF Transcript_14090/g.32477 Transcript_14090/m.32477 type:complete len:212 (+) Transcript_14090:1918-2553(+)